jgi:predicted RNase H-like HicB family nuclease
VRRITITAQLMKEEEGGYAVYCPELDIYTQGEDVDDALRNLKEAAELHIEELGSEDLRLRKVEHREVELEIHV